MEKIYRPQSKNIVTVTWAVAFALVGVILISVFNQMGIHICEGPGSVSPFAVALFPLLMAGVPVLLMTGFIFAVYSIGREESIRGKYQLGVLILATLILAYLFSFNMFAGGNC